MNDKTIAQDLGNIKRKEDAVDKKLTKLEKNSINQTKNNSLDIRRFGFFVAKICLYILAINFMIRYLGGYNIETIVDFILKKIPYFTDINLFGVISFQWAIGILAVVGLIFFYFDFWFLGPWTFIVEGTQNISEFSAKLWRFQEKVFVVLLIILAISTTITITLFSQDSEASPIQTITNGISEKTQLIQESYMWCTLNNPTDITVCKKIQDTKQAEESSKTEYSIKLDKTNILTTYNSVSNPIIDFNYEILTKGGSITITKFECYYTKIDNKNLIDSQTYDEIIKHEVKDFTTFKCDLSKLENFKPNDKLKIIPVLYYTIDSEILQEIPIQTIVGYDNSNEYITKKGEWISKYDSLKPIISGAVISAESLWVPKLPLLTNDEENNKEHTLTFTFAKKSSNSGFGTIVNSTLINITIPDTLDISCGKDDTDCKNSLKIDGENDNAKPKLEMTVKLKNQEYEDFPEFLTLNILTELQIKSSIEIKFENPEYVEPQTETTESSTSTSTETSTSTTSTYWADKEVELTSTKTTVTNEKTENTISSLDDDYEEVLTLIEQGFKVINDGKPLDTKEELTDEEKSQNQEYKDSYKIIENQITNKRNDINQQKQELEQINYNGE